MPVFVPNHDGLDISMALVQSVQSYREYGVVQRVWSRTGSVESYKEYGVVQRVCSHIENMELWGALWH